MRILSIGYPLPNVAIDNYNALTAPSYNDYDALIVDPASITKVARELADGTAEFEAFDDRPIINAPTTASSVSAADQLRRRAEETKRLLEAGGLVVVLARPDAVQGGIFGFEGCDRYHWLPAPGGIAWGMPHLRPGEGKTVRIVAEDHPFAAVMRENRAETSFRATFDDRQPEIRRAGKILATGGAGVPIAIEFSVLGGQVVFIPVMGESSYTNRSNIAQSLVDACVRHGGSDHGAAAPYWVRSQALPGLEQLEAALEESEAAASEATAHAEAVRERHDVIARHRRLLWEDGQQFVSANVEALRLLGFTVQHTAGDPITVESEGVKAYLELESSREQVVEWPYIRLQRRLEEHLLKHGELLKGIVVANGCREKDPEQREDELSQPLRVACENYRYALLSTRTLYELVKRALAGADDAALLAIRRRIMSGHGLIDPSTILGEALEETPESGPIF
ncbi:MAG: hypothetical protein ABI577_18540 [bacterium]